MASTVHLEFPLASGVTLTLDLSGEGTPSAAELELLTRLINFIERSSARAREG